MNRELINSIGLVLLGVFIAFLIKVASTALGFIKYFPNKISGKIWEESQKDLFNFNKSLITLSSSALVLSFTLVGLEKLKISRFSITSFWVLFLISISSGVIIMFIKFLYGISDKMVEIKSDKGKYEDEEPIHKHKEVEFYFKSRILIYWLAVVELTSFLAAMISLTITAFASIN